MPSGRRSITKSLEVSRSKPISTRFLRHAFSLCYLGFLSRDKSGGGSATTEEASPAPKLVPVKSSIPARPTPQEDGDGTSSSQPILVPSGLEEVPDDDDDERSL